MTNIAKRIAALETELSNCVNGYISYKKIRGKEKPYLQWSENGKLKSRYIKSDELKDVRAMIEHRKQIQEEIKALKATPEGLQAANLKRKTARNTQSITGTLMSGDREIAKIKNGDITDYDPDLIPLYLKRTGDVEGWLTARAIDSHRTNSRLLKRALRLKSTDDIQTVLSVNAATLTDNYWFRPDGLDTTYDEIRFRENRFAELALRGDPDSFSHRPSRTPELTNIGSFEKCWKLIDGEWWMYKRGNSLEYFSELFICRLGEKLGLDMAHYEMDGEYIRSKDFTNGASVNFEPMSSLVDDDDDYKTCFEALYHISEKLARQYLYLVWFDSICYNMDRHTGNFGLLRDVKTGEILSLAPNYDNNIALIANGYPSDPLRKNDGLIRFFADFLKNSEKAQDLVSNENFPKITAEIIDECSDLNGFDVDRNYIRTFILSGQQRIERILRRPE